MEVIQELGRLPRQWIAPFMVASLVYVAQAQQPLVPGMFVLGDSLVDPGNNNYISTLAKSNFPPNGVDFPGGSATGRFCNGRTVVDIITRASVTSVMVGPTAVQKMNMNFLPAYLDPNAKGAAILGGVNYASAAGGILDGTGANYIGRIGINQQLQYFQNTQQEITQTVGPTAASKLFAESLYFWVVGSNDYINNYLLQDSATRRQYTPQQYEALLVNEFSRQITTLYNLGARKMAIFNVGPLGCIPSQLANNGVRDGSCVTFINDYVMGFNRALGLRLNTLSTQLTGATLVIGNAYDLVFDKIQNPQNYGLSVVNRGCCGLGAYNGQVPCIQGIQACTQRSQYLFWDPFHPTDAVNVQLGEAFFTGGPSSISPINIQQLAAL